MDIPLFIGIGTVFSYALLTAFAFICALVLGLSPDPSRLTGVGSLVCLLMTAAASSLIITRIRGESGALTAILTAATFVVVRIVISLFTSGTEPEDLIDCLCYLGVGVIFALLGQKKRRKRR